MVEFRKILSLISQIQQRKLEKPKKKRIRFETRIDTDANKKREKRHESFPQALSFGTLTRIILLLMVPLPPPGLPRINTMLDSSSAAVATACVDMNDRAAGRRKATEQVAAAPRWPTIRFSVVVVVVVVVKSIVLDAER